LDYDSFSCSRFLIRLADRLTKDVSLPRVFNFSDLRLEKITDFLVLEEEEGLFLFKIFFTGYSSFEFG